MGARGLELRDYDQIPSRPPLQGLGEARAWVRAMVRTMDVARGLGDYGTRASAMGRDRARARTRGLCVGS